MDCVTGCSCLCWEQKPKSLCREKVKAWNVEDCLRFYYKERERKNDACEAVKDFVPRAGRRALERGVIWCFTPSQLVQLYQGGLERGRPKDDMHL